MNRPVFLSFVLAAFVAAGVFAGGVPGGEEPPVHLRDGWPPPLAAAWFRDPEGSDPLGDIAAQVEAAKNLADARSAEWAAVRDAPGEWNGCSFALTNGFFQARWALDRETTGPADELETWHVFADPEAVRRDEETGAVVADLLFVPAEPYGLPSDAGQKDRFRLDGGRLVPAGDGD